MSTSPAPAPSEPAASPPPLDSPSFERTFRPTGAEALAAQLSYVPSALVYLGAIMIVGVLGQVAGRLGVPPFLALVGSVTLLIAGPRLILGLAAQETHLRIDANGITVGAAGAARPAAWETLTRVRVTKLIYLLTLRSGAAVILPQRVLGEAERRLVEDALAARPALVKRKEVASLATGVLLVLGLLVFVTLYNLFQTGGPPRHPKKSGNTPTSSLRMPSSTDATGRSSFIDPTI